MKKIFYSILLSGMMVLSACDALDLSPEDYYGSNDFWNQKSQVEMFMTGIHADLRDKYQMPVTLGGRNHFIWDRLMACVHITISIFIEHLVVCR